MFIDRMQAKLIAHILIHADRTGRHRRKQSASGHDACELGSLHAVLLQFLQNQLLSEFILIINRIVFFNLFIRMLDTVDKELPVILVDGDLRRSRTRIDN